MTTLAPPPPVQPGPPPLLAAVAVVLATGISLAACGSTTYAPSGSSSQAAPVTTSGSGGSTVTAPSPSPSGTAALAQAQQEESWCTAIGQNDMATVETDLTNLSTDLNNDSLTGTASDGNSLYYDADTAWYDTLPPIDSADYQNAMNSYTQAGADYSNADITDGNASLNTGTAIFSNWISAVTAAGSICTGNEPDVTVSGPTPTATPMAAPLPAFTCSDVANPPPPYGSGIDTVTLSIMGTGPDNAYSQATVKVSSGSWSQTVTMYSSSGWKSSPITVPWDDAGNGCNVLTESAS